MKYYRRRSGLTSIAASESGFETTYSDDDVSSTSSSSTESGTFVTSLAHTRTQSFTFNDLEYSGFRRLAKYLKESERSFQSCTSDWDAGEDNEDEQTWCDEEETHPGILPKVSSMTHSLDRPKNLTSSPAAAAAEKWQRSGSNVGRPKKPKSPKIESRNDSNFTKERVFGIKGVCEIREATCNQFDTQLDVLDRMGDNLIDLVRPCREQIQFPKKEKRTPKATHRPSLAPVNTKTLERKRAAERSHSACKSRTTDLSSSRGTKTKTTRSTKSSDLNWLKSLDEEVEIVFGCSQDKSDRRTPKSLFDGLFLWEVKPEGDEEVSKASCRSIQRDGVRDKGKMTVVISEVTRPAADQLGASKPLKKRRSLFPQRSTKREVSDVLSPGKKAKDRRPLPPHLNERRPPSPGVKKVIEKRLPSTVSRDIESTAADLPRSRTARRIALLKQKAAAAAQAGPPRARLRVEVPSSLRSAEYQEDYSIPAVETLIEKPTETLMERFKLSRAIMKTLGTLPPKKLPSPKRSTKQLKNLFHDTVRNLKVQQASIDAEEIELIQDFLDDFLVEIQDDNLQTCKEGDEEGKMSTEVNNDSFVTERDVGLKKAPSLYDSEGNKVDPDQLAIDWGTAERDEMQDRFISRPILRVNTEQAIERPLSPHKEETTIPRIEATERASKFRRSRTLGGPYGPRSIARIAAASSAPDEAKPTHDRQGPLHFLRSRSLATTHTHKDEDSENATTPKANKSTKIWSSISPRSKLYRWTPTGASTDLNKTRSGLSSRNLFNKTRGFPPLSTIDETRLTEEPNSVGKDSNGEGTVKRSNSHFRRLQSGAPKSSGRVGSFSLKISVPRRLTALPRIKSALETPTNLSYLFDNEEDAINVRKMSLENARILKNDNPATGLNESSIPSTAEADDAPWDESPEQSTQRDPGPSLNKTAPIMSTTEKSDRAMEKSDLWQVETVDSTSPTKESWVMGIIGLARPWKNVFIFESDDGRKKVENLKQVASPRTKRAIFDTSVMTGVEVALPPGVLSASKNKKRAPTAAVLPDPLPPSSEVEPREIAGAIDARGDGEPVATLQTQASPNSANRLSDFITKAERDSPRRSILKSRETTKHVTFKKWIMPFGRKTVKIDGAPILKDSRLGQSASNVKKLAVSTTKKLANQCATPKTSNRQMEIKKKHSNAFDDPRGKTRRLRAMRPTLDLPEGEERLVRSSSQSKTYAAPIHRADEATKGKEDDLGPDNSLLELDTNSRDSSESEMEQEMLEHFQSLSKSEIQELTNSSEECLLLYKKQLCKKIQQERFAKRLEFDKKLLEAVKQRTNKEEHQRKVRERLEAYKREKCRLHSYRNRSSSKRKRPSSKNAHKRSKSESGSVSISVSSYASQITDFISCNGSGSGNYSY